MNRRFQHHYLIVCVVLSLLFSFGFISKASAAQLSDPHIVINIPSRTLWLYDGAKIVHYYPVGVGRVGFQTPMGKYKVIRKIVNPGWEHPYKPAGAVRIKPGPNNPLGTRWMGFKQYHGGEYGIHGTDTPTSVGKFSSHGCVRMKVKDAEALFDQIEVGTPVEVTYNLALIRRKGDDVTLSVFPDTFKKGMPSVDRIKAEIKQEYPQATINEGRVAAALKSMTEKPLSVAIIEAPAPQANASPIETVPSASSAPPAEEEDTIAPRMIPSPDALPSTGNMVPAIPESAFP